LLKRENLYLGVDETSQDYIFNYKLDLGSEGKPIYNYRLAELVRIILENLLNIVVPLKVKKDINIDGFRWLMDKENSYQLFPQIDGHFQSPNRSIINTDTSQGVSNAGFYEPRIDFIKKLTESLLNLIEFEKEGNVVAVDGFRLKNLRDWLVPSAGDPREVFEYTASRCNCDCIFCCNKGNPPSVSPCHNYCRIAEDEFKEIKTRINYFLPSAKQALFPNSGSIYEVTEHLHYMDVLHQLREKTAKPFIITTNGSNLSPTVVAEFNTLKPVYLYLSLNSSSVSRRRKLMKDQQPEVAINALPLLKQQRIPYATVIVPWPVDTVNEMLEDLSSTVNYAAEHDTHLIQINLPGYSRYFSSSKLFDLQQIWTVVVSQVRELREEYNYPIVAIPTMYEENIYQPRKNLPQILGLVKNSPAYISGLRREDLILQINGIRIYNRPQARDLLSILQHNRGSEVSLRVQRNNQTLEISLDLARYSYPYSPDTDNYLGIVFMGTGLRMSYIENLREIIDCHKAKRVLFLSSEIVKPTFEQCLTESRLFGDSQLEITIEIPKNNFFGGNIFMGDLLVVQDFIDCINKHVVQKGCKPDLIIIPSSPFKLSGWGRDLTGRVYLDIERETGIPVELLDCSTIND